MIIVRHGGKTLKGDGQYRHLKEQVSQLTPTEALLHLAQNVAGGWTISAEDERGVQIEFDASVPNPRKITIRYDSAVPEDVAGLRKFCEKYRLLAAINDGTIREHVVKVILMFAAGITDKKEQRAGMLVSLGHLIETLRVLSQNKTSFKAALEHTVLRGVKL